MSAQHLVAPSDLGFVVRSGDSGATYVVTPKGLNGAERTTCSCPAGRHQIACKHIAAVMQYAIEHCPGGVVVQAGSKS